MAKAIVDAWSPAGLDAKTMVPGLGLRLQQVSARMADWLADASKLMSGGDSGS